MERLQLQRRLGCRTFHWFLANVYPELYPSEPRPRFSGKLHNTGLGLCADCQAEGDILGCPMMLAPCSDSRQQQYLQHTSRKEIHFGSPQHLCFAVRQEQVILQNCTEEGLAIHQQHWDFQEAAQEAWLRRPQETYNHGRRRRGSQPRPYMAEQGRERAKEEVLHTSKQPIL
uniref:Polypeptide N-acetylgalactosaminyltransferase-like protein 2 n=2 Tax=Pan TaxID=9596 RepID=G2HJK0_PANTR|nr:polypeptide N-acetylgalactosaminyltransferase-like protein 2 [Pan troglodytes]